MGVPFEEVDLLRAGVEATMPTAGSYALNMIHHDGAWEVRKGFGQVAQYDTSMSTNPKVVMGGPDDIWGYSRVVGSYLMHTRFGHMQVISVIEARNVAGNVRMHNTSYLGQSNWLVSNYCVSIHDLTTNERWEEVIYRNTSEGDRAVAPLYRRLGQYLSCRDLDADTWVATGSSPVWFAEWDGRVLFGNDALGVMLYSPCTFNGNTRKSIDLTRETNWVTGHCESAAVIRVSPSRGLFYGGGTGFAYLKDDMFPAPVAAVTYGDRVVYASGRQLFFSDQFYPTSIMVNNVMDVTTDTDITALAVVGDTLLIMSSTQTFAFRAPAGDAVTQGHRASMLSSSVGCVSPVAVANVENSAVWCDVSGIYMSSGSSVEKLSGSIDRFFTNFITDPVTQWYPLEGAVGVDSPVGTPPRRSLTLRMKPDLLSLSYSEHLDALFVSVPDENMALCYADSQWSVWSFDSNAKNMAPPPDGTLQNIKNPQIICRNERIILVGGLDEQAFTDASAHPVSGAVGDNATSRSYYILEYGRGGGIDRSIDNEDYRRVTGKYIVTPSSTGIVGAVDANLGESPHDYYGGWLTIDPWIKVPARYALPSATTPTANDRTYLLPISIVPPKQWGVMPTAATAQRAVHRIEFRFTYDSTKWAPVFVNAATPTASDISFVVPSERLASVSGYTGGSGILRAEDVAGAAAVAGPVVHVVWQGLGVPNTWYHHPVMNLNALRKTTILYIPMISLVASSTVELSGMALAPHTTAGSMPLLSGLSHTAPLSAAFWEQWSVGAPRKEDNVAQPVDWAYKSEEVGLGTPDRLSARGIAATVLSRGQGPDPVTTFPFRLFNTLVAADQKMTMAQPLDHTGQYTWTGSNPTRRPVSIQTNVYPTPGGLGVVNTPHDTLRHRLIKSDNTLHQVTFDHPVADVAVWGTDGSTNVNHGDVLIGDEQVDTIITSDNLKCTSFSYLMFGFIQNRAEAIKLELAKGLYRNRGGGRRRRGR